MRVYLAGPMRGLPDWNFPAFDEARQRLTDLGHVVYCPALLARAMPYYERGKGECDRNQLLHVIQTDLACLYTVEAIALLPGWERSVGATVELAMAQFLVLKVLDTYFGAEMWVDRCPWDIGKPILRPIELKLGEEFLRVKE